MSLNGQPQADVQICLQAIITENLSGIGAVNYKLHLLSQLLHLTPGENIFLSSFESSSVVQSEDGRSLGVILDDHLSFSAHVVHLTLSCIFLLCKIQSLAV